MTSGIGEENSTVMIGPSSASPRVARLPGRSVDRQRTGCFLNVMRLHRKKRFTPSRIVQKPSVNFIVILFL